MSNEVSLEATLSLKDQMSTPLQGAIGKIGSLEKAFNSLATAGKVALGAVTAALVLLGKEAIASAQHLEHLSNQTGISVTNLQKMGFAAEASGNSLDEMAGAMRIMSSHLQQAAQGSKEADDLFYSLGITIRDSSGHVKSAEQAFGEFADVIQATTNPTERMALATKVLGRSGADLLPILKDGAAGLYKVGNAAEQAGFLMSKDTVKALDELGNQFGIVKTTFVNLMGTWLASTGITVPKIIDYFLSFAKIVNDVRTTVTKYFREYQEDFRFAINIFNIGYETLENLTLSAVGKMIAPFADFFKTIGQGMVSLNIIGQDTFNAMATAMDRMSAKGNQSFADIIANGWSNAKTALKDYGTALQTVDKEEDEAGAERERDIETFRRSLNGLSNGAKDAEDANTKLGNSAKGAARDLHAEAQTIEGGLNLAIKDLISQVPDWRKAWGDMFSTMQGSMSSMFQGLIEKGGQWKDVMKSFFRDVKSAFIKMVADMAAQAIMKNLIGGGLSFLGLGGGGPGAPAAGVPVATVAGSTNNVGGGGGGLTGGAGGLFGISGGDTIAGDLTVGGLGAGLGVAAVGAGIAQQGIKSGNVTKGTVGGLVAGAALGATIGSVIPGVGTVIGGVIGGVVGAVSGFFSSRRKKKKLKRQREAAARAAAAAQAAFEEQARGVIMNNSRNLFGGGLATEDEMGALGHLMSGGISSAEIAALGGAQQIAASQPVTNKTINVSVPQITVHANVSGSYDAQQLAQDLGLQLTRSIQSAAAGL